MTTLLPQFTDEEIPRASSDDEPGFGSLATAKGRLPLRAMDIQGRIDGLLSQVTVRQTFVNAWTSRSRRRTSFRCPTAPRYRFPHGGGRSIIEGLLRSEQRHARSTTGDRGGAARVHRRGGAARRFHAAGRQPDAGERATVELTICGVLPYSDGEVTFRFPLVVAPRYIPGIPLSGPSVGDGTAVDTDAVPDASRISPPVLLPGFPNPVRLSLTIDLYDTAASPPMDVRVEPARGPDRRERGFAGFGSSRAIASIAISSSGSAWSRDPVADPLHAHLPSRRRRRRPRGDVRADARPASRVESSRRRPRDVVFVLDRSGSMEGWKMVAARRALARMVDTLGEMATGSPSSPSTTGSRLRPALASGLVPRPIGIGFRRRVPGEDQCPGRDRDGRTALQAAHRLIGKRRVTRTAGSGTARRDAILVLVTDGQVGNEDQILQALAPELGGIRVFTLGIDRAVNEGFLRAPGRAGAWPVRAGRVGGSARRGDGGDSPSDRYAASDRPGPGAGRVHD